MTLAGPVPFDDASRRARLVRRHRLAPPFRAETPEEIAASLVAIHSTDPATVFLSVGARLRGNDPVPDLERALYADRTLIRMHGMRRTIFVFPGHLAAVVHASTTASNAMKLRAELARDMQAFNPEWDVAWLDALEAKVISYLQESGPAAGTAISTAIPELRQSLVYNAGRREVKQGLASRVLRSLGNENRIVRGKPAGSWISGQYRWSVAEPHPEIDPAGAKCELIRHWLAAYGPGSLEDMKWWTGWSLRDVRTALAQLDTVEVTLETGPGYVLRGDDTPDEPVPPAIALLPALDSTSMGYRQRDWYLSPDHIPALFDYSGNIGPTIWWGGRIVGGWAQRKDGEIVTEFLEAVPPEAHEQLAVEISRMREWLGPVRITPRFPTPIDKRLVAT